MLEVDLVGAVVTYLEELGYAVRREVPIGLRWADLVGFREGEALAVELKLSDWRGALAQAMSYQLGAVRACVALPFPAALHAFRNRFYFDREGVGLWAVHPPEGGVRPLIAPRPSERLFRPLEDAVRSMGDEAAGFAAP